jgi:D-amino-acid dehydrogenase
MPHCIVIGAGIVGAACAWHLRRNGADVTLIDSELPGQSTSFGNAGCIAPSNINPFSYPGAILQVPRWLIDPLGPMRIRWSDALQLTPWFWKFWRAGKRERVAEIVAAQATLMSSVTEDYDRILAETGGESLRETRGGLILYENERDFAKDSWQYDFKRQHGLPWKRLARDELAALEPDLNLGDGVAILDPRSSHVLDPAAVAGCFADAAIAAGVSWIHDRVQAVSASAEGVTVQTESGSRLDSDQLVVAAGVWSNRLTSQLGHSFPLMAKRGYHSMISNPSVNLSHPVMYVSEYIVLTPMNAGLRVAGTAEFAAIDAPPDYRRAKVLMQHARRFLPGLEGGGVTEWMGQRPMMPDSLPVIGPLPGHRNVLCAFGHGHYGLTQGPTTGRIISDLAFGREPHIDLSAYAPDRF